MHANVTNTGVLNIRTIRVCPGQAGRLNQKEVRDVGQQMGPVAYPLT